MAPLCRFRQRRRALAQPEGIYAARANVSGSIHTAREMTVQSTSGGHELDGKVGGGGFLLDVSTVSGSISVD